MVRKLIILLDKLPYFKATNPKLPSMVEAFGKLIKSYNFDGFVGMGQIVHGTENGESVYIYGTYSNLNDAFNFGPQLKRKCGLCRICRSI